MKRLTAALLALLLALTLLFAACAPPAGTLPTPSNGTEKETAVTVAEDAPADGTPVDERANAPPAEDAAETETGQAAADAPDEDGWYYSKEDVALYLYTYGRLPANFITKKEARQLGWESGALEPFAPGKCIGGDRFGNYEGLLPEAPGRYYTECDIDTRSAKKRGAKRIVFSNDGLIYYTEDHYESFTLLYGEE